MAKMKNIGNNKFWRGCKATEMPMNGWWECKLTQSLCKMDVLYET